MEVTFEPRVEKNGERLYVQSSLDMFISHNAERRFAFKPYKSLSLPERIFLRIRVVSFEHDQVANIKKTCFLTARLILICPRPTYR